MENSPELLQWGMWTVIHAFTSIGYCLEWQCLQASDFGFPHKRKRVYIVAYPFSKRLQSIIFQPIGSVQISTSWTPTEDYLLVSRRRAQPDADIEVIRFNDGVHKFCDGIKALGNAVQIACAEYVFRCIIQHNQLKTQS